MSDWTTDAADAIERTVALVREQTVDRVRSVVKGVVYGLLAVLLVVPALVLLLIGSFRGLVLVFQGEVWAAWSTLGGIFVVLGGLLWSRRGSA